MSIEDDRKLLQSVQGYKPPAELHPIAMVAWNLYETAGNKVTPEVLQSLREALAPLTEDLNKLGEAGLGLARFMVYANENLGDKEAGQAIADLLREYAHLYEPFWRSVGEALRNVSAEAGSAFQAFAGSEGAPKSAPVFGEAAPKGSVPLRNLAPARPPPPPKRPPPHKRGK